MHESQSPKRVILDRLENCLFIKKTFQKSFLNKMR